MLLRDLVQRLRGADCLTKTDNNRSTSFGMLHGMRPTQKNSLNVIFEGNQSRMTHMKQARMLKIVSVLPFKVISVWKFVVGNEEWNFYLYRKFGGKIEV